MSSKQNGKTREKTTSALPLKARKQIDTVRSDFYRRNDLPYGVWICADRREVLFNRFYEPIWQRRPGEPVSAADPHEWVPWSKQDYFYDDGVRDKQKTERGKAALVERGINEART